jgi:hypothetical protein
VAVDPAGAGLGKEFHQAGDPLDFLDRVALIALMGSRNEPEARARERRRGVDILPLKASETSRPS